MTSLVPSSIADDRFRALDQVAAARFGALPVTKVLVYIIDSVDESALPALAWQFGALGEVWRAATTAEAQRALLKRVLRRRFKRGSDFAVWDALDAAGYTARVRSGNTMVPVRHDGHYRHNGVVRLWEHLPYIFWVIVVDEPDAPSLATIQAIVREWQRKSVRFEVFWVQSAELLNQTTEYHAVTS